MKRVQWAWACLFCVSVGGLHAADPPRVLMLTKSQGFEHSVVHRKSPEELSMAERIVTDLGKTHGFDVTCTKDGTTITPEGVRGYDVLYFFTQGEIDGDPAESRDKAPAVPKETRGCVLEFVEAGGGFVGTHCGGADTWHNWREGKIKPFLDMVGGEFIGHGAQQVSTVRVVDPKFPALAGWPAQLSINDEWYAYKGFQKNMRILLMLETEGMSGLLYKRDDYPITWCSNHGRGRVFYTGLGHREDVWENPLYQQMVAKAILWAAGKIDGDASSNLEAVYGDAQSALTRLNDPPKATAGE